MFHQCGIRVEMAPQCHTFFLVMSSHIGRPQSEADVITRLRDRAAGFRSFKCALHLVMGEETKQLQTAQPLGSHGTGQRAIVPALCCMAVGLGLHQSHSTAPFRLCLKGNLGGDQEIKDV